MMNVLNVCPFYKNNKNLPAERAKRFCSLTDRPTLCAGEIECCEHPDMLKDKLLTLEKKTNLKHSFDEVHDHESIYKILMVEDEKSVRELMKQLLLSGGYTSVAATNGVDALQKMEEIDFDLVITDIRMPEMDGITLTHEILKRWPRMPVIVITGFNNEYTAESIIQIGARDFIEKPFSREGFLLRIKKVLRDQEIFNQIETKQQELRFKINQKRSEETDLLKQEIETLKNQLNAVYSKTW